MFSNHIESSLMGKIKDQSVSTYILDSLSVLTLATTSLRFIFVRDTRIYLILRRIVPGKKKPVTQKLFSLFAATMARSGFCPYHGLCCEDSPTKHIGVIPTPWTKICALGLGVLVPQPEL
jgi:hypothetical protein